MNTYEIQLLGSGVTLKPFRAMAKHTFVALDLVDLDLAMRSVGKEVQIRDDGIIIAENLLLVDVSVEYENNQIKEITFRLGNLK